QNFLPRRPRNNMYKPDSIRHLPILSDIQQKLPRPSHDVIIAGGSP
ncbi:MAG: hypothetical protein ACI9NC_001207, partial [Verrucomicrobiales bacterium]